MSAFETLFGRTYNSVGNSNADFIIKTRGQVKVQWGKKFIDIIKDGKLNVNMEVIKKVATIDRISTDGIYYVEDTGKVMLKVGGVVIDLSDDGSGTFVSYISQQEVTPEQREMALGNIGLRYKSEEDAAIAGVESGIVYLDESQRWYIVKDGAFTLYPSELSNPYNNQIVINKSDGNKGALVIEGSGVNNSVAIGGKDGMLLYRTGQTGYITNPGNISIFINNTEALIITPDSLTAPTVTTSMLKSEGATQTDGYRLYVSGVESTLEVDNLIVRNSSSSTTLTYSDLMELVTKESMSVGSSYIISDFQNEWELTTEEDAVLEDEVFENEETGESEVVRYKNVRPLVVIPNSATTIGSAHYVDDPEWNLEYDISYADDIIVPVYNEDGSVKETLSMPAKGRITKLTDEKGNSCNYDFKHLRFKVTEDGEEKWVYTFRDGENDLSLSDTCVGNVLTVNNYEIKSETITVRDGNVVTLSGSLTNNNFGTINSNMTINGTFNKFTVDGVLENVAFKDLSSISKVSTLSLTNVVFNGDVSNTIFHSDISDVDFDETTYALLYDATKVKDVYFNNDVVSVICIPDIPTSSSALSKGMIMMFDGNSDIPTGWAVCDGTNGTPDLTGNFIKAATTAGETGTFIPAAEGTSTEEPISYYSLVFIMKVD